MRFLLITYLFIFCLGSKAQSPYYVKVISSDYQETYNNITIIDSTIIFFGNTLDTGNTQTILFEKRDFDLNLLQRRVYFNDSIIHVSANGEMPLILNNAIYSFSFDFGGATGYSTPIMLKVDMDGDTLMLKRFDFGVPAGVNNGGIDQEKNFIVSGIYDDNVFVMKTDSMGNVLWTREIPSPYPDYTSALAITSDTGCIISGNFSVSGTTSSDAFYAKLDRQGNVEWLKTYGDVGGEYTYITALGDGSYVLSGNHAPSTFSSQQNCRLRLIEENGDTLWDRIYDFNPVKFDRLLSSVVLAVDGFTVLGTFRPFTKQHPLIAKFDYSGNLLWHRKYILNINGSSIVDHAARADGSFMVAGFIFPDTAGPSQLPLLMHLNCLGYDTVPYPKFLITNDTTIALPQTLTFENHSRYADSYLWEFGDGTSYFHASNPADTLSSEPFIAHTYQQPGQYTVTLHAIACKDTTSYEKTYIIEPGQIQDGELLSIYPNPAQEQLNIWLHNADINQQYQMLVLDASGRLVMDKSLMGSALNTGFTVDVSNRESGVYILRVGGQSKRFVISP